MPRAKNNGIDWPALPWAERTDYQLAKKLGVSRTKTWEMRRECAAETQSKWRAQWQDWEGQDWTLHNDDIAKARSCSPSAVNKARRWLNPGVKSERRPGSGRKSRVMVDSYDLTLSVKDNAARLGCSGVYAGQICKRLKMLNKIQGK